MCKNFLIHLNHLYRHLSKLCIKRAVRKFGSMPIENFETRHKAITNDGQIYSYILKYFENLSKLNYFVKEEESIGNEMPRLMDSLKVKETLKDKNNKSTYYKRFSEYLLKSKLYPIETKGNKCMVLRLL